MQKYDVILKPGSFHRAWLSFNGYNVMEGIYGTDTSKISSTFNVNEFEVQLIVYSSGGVDVVVEFDFKLPEPKRDFLWTARTLGPQHTFNFKVRLNPPSLIDGDGKLEVK